MSDKTGIEWTDHTFNPWWGCVRVSPACEHCYAETWAKRFGVEWGVKAERKPASEKVWASPLRWNKAAQKAGVRARVFCASMADVFEDRRDLDVHRRRLFDIIAITPWLDWQLLTKRPEAVMRLVPESWNFYGWPKNVWIGTTVEDQRRADERIPHLLAIPAVVRFLSCEPLLGPLNLHPWLCAYGDANKPEQRLGEVCEPAGNIHWVIGGGESGNGARPMHPEWARALRDQCAAAGVPFFFKQWGEWMDATSQDPITAKGQDLVILTSGEWIGGGDGKKNGMVDEHWRERGGAWMVRVGKKNAGALLDGVEHKAFPVVQP